MTSVAILQPSYLPWLGFFDQISKVDHFVFLDDVQYTRRDWRNRNKVKVGDSEKWLTVPVLSKGKYYGRICDILIDNSSPWQRKHLNLLEHNYGKAPYYREVLDLLLEEFAMEHSHLSEFNIALIKKVSAYLGVKDCTYHCSSEMEVEDEDKILRLARICKALGADHYLTGDSARNYLCANELEDFGIAIEFQNYQHPVYKQYGDTFLSHLSVLDLLFHQGEKAKDLFSHKLSSLDLVGSV